MFSQIIGHQRIKASLKEVVESGRIAPAYLFSGPDRIGKARLAVGFARMLIQDQSPNHPDLFITRPQNDTSPIKIDQVRSIEARLSLRPYQAPCQVAVIDEADRMNDEAQNCLLKTLEESSPSSVIILVSSRKEKLFATIRSRCQDIIFRPMPREDLARELIRRFSINPDQAHFLARLSDGRIGWAIRLWEDDFLGDKNSVIDDFLNQNAWPEEWADLERALRIMMSWYRDLLIVSSGGGPEGLINLDRQDEITRLAGGFSNRELEDSLELLDSSFRILESHANLKLVVEDLRARLARR